MNTKEKYNEMICFIEDMINATNKDNVYYSASKIVEKVINEIGFSAREANTIFVYLTGYSVNAYVKNRKMMAAYFRMMQDSNNEVPYDWNKYIEQAGFETQQSFGTGFIKVFNVAPARAYSNRDESLYEPPLFWDFLSGGYEMITEKDNTVCKFGISTDVLNKYEEAENLQVIFGLPYSYSEAAFRISEEYSIDMRRVFEYIDYRKNDLFIEDEELSPEEIYDKFVEFDAAQIKSMVMCDYIPLSQIHEVADLINHGMIDVENDKDIVNMYLDKRTEKLQYYELKKLYIQFHNAGEDNNEYFMDFINEYFEDGMEEDLIGWMDAYEHMFDDISDEYSEEDLSKDDEKIMWAQYDEKHNYD